MKANYSKLVYIMDRSGSMHGLTEKSVEGFNKFVEDQKKIEGTADLTLVIFDTEYETVFEDVDIQKVRQISANDIFARGMTALHDSVGRTIDSLGLKLDKLTENEKPEHVVVVVMTDGHENSSKEYSAEQIKKLITQQEDDYNWNFLFMGANQDSFVEGGKLGFKASNISNYVPSDFGTRSAYASTSNFVGNIRGKIVNKSLADTYKDEEEKQST